MVEKSSPDYLSYATASEVATMELLRCVLKVPAPKVLAYYAFSIWDYIVLGVWYWVVPGWFWARSLWHGH
ncbi:hypothetical protein BDV19DRAFT_364418 [Aspergillus venezuelensis]